MNMELKSKRICLRPWREEDAEALYLLARVPEIGGGAGFPPHTDPEMSRAVLRNVLSQPETYAVTNRKTGEIIGSAWLELSLEGNERMKAGEGEVGYWIARHLWGWGYATEVVGILAEHAARDLGLSGLWGACFPENTASRRVLEKSGFVFSHRQSSYLAQLDLSRATLYFYRSLAK